MSDPANGNGHTTIVQATTRLGGQVISNLLPQFLALIIINGLFLVAFLWFVDQRSKHTVAIIEQLMSACLDKKG